MADSARKLIKHNKLDHIIEVIKLRIEDIPEYIIPANSVDCIVSEPLGTYLFNERMLETYVIARDKFLKKDGRMWPTECDFFIMPFQDEELFYETLQKTEFWHN
jgi:type I protein arginine methyltransferase